jgi:nucleoside-diphosphate-sugar epimerase
MKILVTGATGFVGVPLIGALRQKGYDVAASGMEKQSIFSPNIVYFPMPNIDASSDWSQALRGVDAVIHLAARTHIAKERKADVLSLYRKINADGTRQLAKQAAAAGVKRFIFLSSIKVNGEGRARPYVETDAPDPKDAYGQTKYEAENILRKISAQGMNVIILRPPLLYGKNAKGNFRNLAQAVSTGIPLPLANIANRRSLLYLGNLIDVILLCLEKNLEGTHLFLVSDGEDLSTTDLARAIAKTLGKPARFFPVPAFVLRLLARLMGRADAADRILGDLTIDSSLVRQVLGWTPKATVQQGMRDTFSF